MFGFYRTMLAVWVMACHLVGIPVIGVCAVFSFFVLSGFLMTTIMHESYGYDISGIKRYAVNRFLRLYPMYWAFVLISIIAILVISEEYSKGYKSVLYIPDSISGLLFNCSMIFPLYNVEPRLSPPTWALTVEIFFYVCIAFGISKTKKITFVWVTLSIIYYILSYIIDLTGPHRHATIFAASLPFSLGSLLFYYKPEVFRIINKIRISSPIFILSIYIFNAAVLAFNSYYSPFSCSNYIGEIGRYSNILLSLLVVTSLFYKGGEIFSKKLDKTVGDYSYPIYLGHWQCGLVASFILYDSPTKGMSIDGIISFSLSLVLVFALSFIIIQLIDKNISHVRNRIKFKKAI